MGGGDGSLVASTDRMSGFGSASPTPCERRCYPKQGHVCHMPQNTQTKAQAASTAAIVKGMPMAMKSRKVRV